MSKVLWSYARQLNALHALERLAVQNHLADQKLEVGLRATVAQIMDRLALAEVDVRVFWSRFMHAGDDSLSDTDRITQALQAAGCNEWTIDTTTAALVRRLAEARVAVNEVYPRMDDQLSLRARPLKDQWDTYGPGLLRLIGKLTHPDLLPNRMTLVLVHPASGGYGQAYPEERRGVVEAVLTNVVPGIPEVVRVAWVLASICLGHSQSNRLVAPEHLPRVGSLASIPIVIHAAAELELLQETSLDSLLPRIAEFWETEIPADVLQRWWEQQQTGSVPFAVGLKALDRMLETS